MALPQFRNNYEEFLDLSRFPDAAYHESDWGPEGGAYPTSGYYTTSEQEGNVLRTLIDPYRQTRFSDIAGDPEALKYFLGKTYSGGGAQGSPQNIAYSLMNLLGPTATTEDWRAALAKIDPSQVNAVVDAVQGQQKVLANAAKPDVLDYAENAIMPAVTGVLTGGIGAMGGFSGLGAGVGAAGTAGLSGLTTGQLASLVGATSGGVAGAQNGDSLSDVLKGAAIGGATGGAIGGLKDYLFPGLPDLASTPPNPFGVEPVSPVTAPAAPQPLQLATAGTSDIGLGGTNYAGEPNQFLDAAKLLETPAGGSFQTAFGPGAADSLDRSLIGPSAGALPGSGSAFAPTPIQAASAGGNSSQGGKVDPWELPPVETNFPGEPTGQDGGATGLPLPTSGDPQEIFKRILAGGALGPELRRLLGLPEPAATGGNGGTSIYDALGRMAPAALGYLASTKQTEAYDKLARDYMGLGAPSRQRYEASFAPGFSMANEPGYKDAIDASTDALLRRGSLGGNPYGNPGVLAEINKYVTSNTALPALSEYRRTNAGAGGLAALTSAAPAAASGAIQSQGNAYNSIGGGIADVMNPPRTLDEIFKAMKKNTGWGTSLT